MKIKVKIFFFITLITSCSQPEFRNPFDSEYTLPAPSNLNISQQTVSSCQLTWIDNSTGEQGFRIDRQKDSAAWQVGYAEVGENVTELNETDLIINSTYAYRIYGFAGDNTSSLLKGSFDNTIPAPENLTYTFENISYPTADIHLAWDYTITGTDGFKVKKNGTLLPDIIPAGTTEWTDAGVNIENSYFYQVLAFYQSYNSAYSNEVETEAIRCIDIDGNIYQTIQIGDQEWMAENLKVTHYRNGEEIPHLTDSGAWTSTTSGAYCVYGNTPSNADTYGNLYNWYAVNDPRGLAPEGWRIPEDEEIMELEMYLGMTYEEAHSTGYRGTNEGSKLAGRADLWNNGALENDPEFGSSGFAFLPGGYRDYYNGYFGGLGYYGFFWSATEYNTNSAWRRYLGCNNPRVSRGTDGKLYGFSVRCVRSVE